MKLKNDLSGIAHVALIALVIVIAVVGFAGWKVWANNKSNSDSSASSQSETSQATNDGSTDSTKKYLEITQMSVQFEVPSTVSDLKVDSFQEFPAENGQAASAVAVLNSPALEAEGKIKTSGTQERHEKLGQIVRQKNGSIYHGNTTIEDYAKNNKFAGVKIGDYYYVYVTTYAAENADTYLNAIKTSIETSLKSKN